MPYEAEAHTICSELLSLLVGISHQFLVMSFCCLLLLIPGMC